MAITLQGDGTVQVRAEALGAEGPVALDNLRVGEAEPVAEPHAEDDVLGLGPREEWFSG